MQQRPKPCQKKHSKAYPETKYLGPQKSTTKNASPAENASISATRKSTEFEEKEGEKRTVVKKTEGCVVFCRGCEDICPQAR